MKIRCYELNQVLINRLAVKTIRPGECSQLELMFGYDWVRIMTRTTNGLKIEKATPRA